MSVRLSTVQAILITGSAFLPAYKAGRSVDLPVMGLLEAGKITLKEAKEKIGEPLNKAYGWIEHPPPGHWGARRRIAGYFLASASSFDPSISTTSAPIGFSSERTGTEIWMM